MSAGHWSEGYATGAAYSAHYFHDLNPRRAAFVMLLEGLEGPPPGPCCELGFGHGVSLAIHAAAQPERRWWGNDFMPEHAAHARRLVDASGADAVVTDQSFEEFFARDDLPPFAFVGLHGVWSWISPANRERIVGFLRRHLMPGGVVYMSWNALAGYAAMLPLRDAMLQHFRAAGPARSDLQRARDALAFARRLVDSGCATADATPALKTYLAELTDKAPEFVLHELLNEDWHPLSFADVAGALAGAKLVYACSSDLHDRVSGVSTSAPQDALLAQIEPAALRASARDLMLGTRFRRAYWVRGAQPLARAEAVRRLEAQRLVLAMAPAEVPRHIAGPAATHALDPAQLRPLLELFERADGPLPLGAAIADARSRRADPNGIVEMVSALVGMRALLPAADDETIAAARGPARRLNTHLIGPQSRGGKPDELATPVSGGAVPAPASLRLMLAARAAVPDSPAAWPDRVWELMQAEGQQMMKAGAVVSDRATALAALRPLVDQFRQGALPALRRLQVVDD
jgi:SAM-dependent methyltransferase